jgi:hypothetical protein
MLRQIQYFQEMVCCGKKAGSGLGKEYLIDV